MLQRKVLIVLLALVAFAPGARAQGPGYASSHSRQAGEYAKYGRYVARPHSRAWVAGHHEVVQRTVWVPGQLERRWVPARYETRRDAYGRTCRTLVGDGYWQLVTAPGRYERRPVRVWVSGRWHATFR